jgi:hypothetical protein
MKEFEYCIYINEEDTSNEKMQSEIIWPNGGTTNVAKSDPIIVLNYLGDQGWELVSEIKEGKTTKSVFKREKD